MQKGDANIGALQHGVEGKEINASWVIELHQKGNCCPIIVEDLTQPQQMLVEVRKLDMAVIILHHTCIIMLAVLQG